MSAHRRDRIRQRFECVECGAWSTVHVDPKDTEQTIRYACAGSCEGVTEHEPEGATNWFDTPDR